MFSLRLVQAQHHSNHAAWFSSGLSCALKNNIIFTLKLFESRFYLPVPLNVCRRWHVCCSANCCLMLPSPGQPVTYFLLPCGMKKHSKQRRSHWRHTRKDAFEGKVRECWDRASEQKLKFKCHFQTKWMRTFRRTVISSNRDMLFKKLSNFALIWVCFPLCTVISNNEDGYW